MPAREVDYLASASHERFGKLLATMRRYVVPRVYGEYCSDSAGAGRTNPAARESEAVQHCRRRGQCPGRGCARPVPARILEWGMVQTDPHFANYRFRLDERGTRERIVLLDIGATRVFGRASSTPTARWCAVRSTATAP